MERLGTNKEVTESIERTQSLVFDDEISIRNEESALANALKEDPEKIEEPAEIGDKDFSDRFKLAEDFIEQKLERKPYY